jgi:hypothetical protein
MEDFKRKNKENLVRTPRDKKNSHPQGSEVQPVGHVAIQSEAKHQRKLNVMFFLFSW